MQRRNYFISIVILSAFFHSCMADTAIAVPNEEFNQTNSSSIEEYVGSVQAKIKSNWRPPKSSVSESPVVRFNLSPEGRVTNLQIYKASENSEMNSSAITAVETAAPFPNINISPYDKKGIYVEMAFGYNVRPKETLAVLKSNRLIGQAQRSFEKGDWQAAADILDNGLSADPDNIEIKRRLSDVYTNQARALITLDSHSAKAADLAKKAFSLDPNNEEAKRLLTPE